MTNEANIKKAKKLLQKGVNRVLIIMVDYVIFPDKIEQWLEKGRPGHS